MQRLILFVLSAFGIWMLIPVEWYRFVVLVLMLAIAVFLAEGFNAQDRIERSKW